MYDEEGFGMKVMARVSKHWGILFLLAVVMMGGLFSGCGCEPEPLPPPPPPEMSVSPKNWVISKKDLVIIPGVDFRVYEKFTITNSSDKKDAEALEVKEIKITKKSTDSKAEFNLITQKCPDKFDAATDQEKQAKGCKASDCMILSGTNTFCAALPLSLPQSLKVGDKGLEFVVEFKPSSDGIVPIADIEIKTNAPDPDAPDVPETTTRVRVSAQAGEAEIVVSIGGGKLKDEATRTRWGYSFAPTEEGKKVEQPFSLSNNGDGTLNYSFTWADGTEDPKKSFDVVDENGKSVLGEKLNLAPKQLANFKLTFVPQDCDEHTTSLQISSNGIPKDYGEGTLKSARLLYVDMRGSSPASATVDPNTLVFDNVKPNTEAKKTFKISVGDSSLCSLKIYSLNFGRENPNDKEPQDYRFGDMTKGGSTVTAPSAGAPVSLNKGEELIVEVIYAPKVAGGENAVILLDSNDKTIGDRVVTITGGTTSQIKPLAKVKFLCGQDNLKTGNNTRCNTDEAVIAREIDLEANKSAKVFLDGSESTSIPVGSKQITKYKWELVSAPRGSAAQISDADKAKATIVVDKGDRTGTAVYKIKLTVTDEDGLEGTITEDLIVYSF